MAMKMDVWQWGDVKGVDEELCNNLALFAEDNKIDCMNMTENEFVALKDEYLMKNYGNKGVFSKKSLKERKKFQYGDEIIKFLEKYGYNKRGEDFEQNKDYSTVTYMYAIPHGMRPQTPYVEFTVDADNDAFIFGEYFTDGRKGYSTEFDSVEDLEYFVSNANYSNVDLTEKKYATKSIKEKYEYKVDEITDIIRSHGFLFDSCNILDDYAWNIEHGKTTWLSKHAYDEISIAYANCIQYLKDWYNGKKKDELINDLTKFFDKVISLTESKKSTRKSMKESKIDFQSVIDKVIPKEYAKNKNAYKYALSCVESLYNEDEYDSDSAKVYFLNCYISDSFPSWVDELGEEEMDALANALYDGTMKWSDIDSSWLE